MIMITIYMFSKDITIINLNGKVPRKRDRL